MTRALVSAAGALVLLALAAPAEAYPQFQFSTYNSRCGLCHFSPSGGGLINGFGRDESGDTVSARGGDGGFLHGAWNPPKWLQLGADFRFAGLAKENTGEAKLLAIPMQADLYSRLAFGPVTFNLIAGLRGTARAPRRPVAQRIFSREHYLQYQPKATGLYLRAGRFFPTFGLRLQDHTVYVRRFLGQHSLEEPYGAGGGYVKDEWELHASVFAPPPIPLLHVGVPRSGGALYYERRIKDDEGAYAVQAKAAFGPDDAQYTLGGLLKLWFDDSSLLLLSELDLGVQTFSAGDTRVQMTGYVGASKVLKQGWWLTGALERHDADLLLGGDGRDAVSLTLQYFVKAHFELVLMGKLEAQGEDYTNPSELAMFMLHYYL